jgi:hypothetical protein
MQMLIGGHAIRLLASARDTTGLRLSPSGDPICLPPCFSEVIVRGLLGILWDHRELSTICTLGLLGTQVNVTMLAYEVAVQFC